MNNNYSIMYNILLFNNKRAFIFGCIIVIITKTIIAPLANTFPLKRSENASGENETGKKCQKFKSLNLRAAICSNSQNNIS